MREWDVIIPTNVLLLGPENTEALVQCSTIPSSLMNRDLESALEVTGALSQPDFVNTPKVHRKRKIHAAFSQAFRR